MIRIADKLIASFVVCVGFSICKNSFITWITNEVALTQMTNSSYVVDLTLISQYANIGYGLLLLLCLYLLWRKEIKNTLKEKKENN